MFEYLYTLGKAKMQQRFGNERGQGLTEYGVILAIVVAIAVTLVATTDSDGSGGGFGTHLQSIYNNIASSLKSLASDLN